MKGDQGVRTGDINFAAACMCMGVPLNQRQPCTITLREGKPDYGSFYLGTVTADGKLSTADLSRFWSRPDTATGVFAQLMRFIREHPPGCKSSADWFDHAHAWLFRQGHRPVDAPRSLASVPDFVDRHPNDLAGHVFAFPYNRETCLQEYRAAVPDVFMQHGGRVTKVSTKLDKRQAGELLARLKG